MKNIPVLIFFMIVLAFTQTGTSYGQSAAPEYQHANKLFAEGRYTDAITRYQAILAAPVRDISSSILHTRIGDSYFRLADYRRALEAYRKAMNGQVISERAPTQYWIAFSTFLLGRHAEAVDEFLQIPANYPASGMWVSTAYYWAGRVSERMGKKDQAADYYRKAAGSGKATQERFAMKKADSVKKGASSK